MKIYDKQTAAGWLSCMQFVVAKETALVACQSPNTQLRCGLPHPYQITPQQFFSMTTALH